MKRLDTTLTLRGTLTAILALSFACEPFDADPYSSGGIAPDPVAVIEGAIAYTGPRPFCDDEGTPLGRLLLFLWSADNPPAPVGTATFPVSATYVSAEELFLPSTDCMPSAPTAADEAVFVSRFADFAWAQVPLSQKVDDNGTPQSQTYTVTVTFDRDQDQVPTVSVLAGSTQGDVLGGNLTSIVVDPVSERPNGQLIQGVNIGVGLPVNTEPPLCRIGDDDGSAPALSSEAPIPLSADPSVLEASIAALTPLRLDMISSDEGYDAALAALGLDFDFGPLGHAWYVRELDADSDGTTDTHPFFGAFGIPWRTPAVFLERARTLAEQSVGLPRVVMIANATSGKEVRSPSLDLALPATAAVLLSDADECQIPYFAPGNALPVFLSTPAACHELPTGRYTLNVLHGVAAGTPLTELSTEESDTTLGLYGGRFANQRWVIPNALGAPDSRYSASATNQIDPPGVEAGSAESITIDAQGPAGRFWVVDPDPSSEHTCTQALDPSSGTQVDIPFMTIPAECCAAVTHLCGLPLCEAFDAGDGRMIREATELDEDGNLTCVPFEMPPSCCAVD